MSAELHVLDPLGHPGWEDFLAGLPGAGFFHSRMWARVLHAAYGYGPAYFALLDRGAPVGLLPMMDIRSRLTGRRGVSLPFTDYCDPLAADGQALSRLVCGALEHGARAGWRYAEFRSSLAPPEAGPVARRFFRHVLRLADGEACLQASMRGPTRTALRKSAKEGVRVDIRRDEDAMKIFCGLNSLTRRQHGLPPQPRRFFDALLEFAIRPGSGFIAVGSQGGRPVAADVFVLSRPWMVYKYGASDVRSQHARPSNAVLWAAIRWGIAEGYEHLCMGRTDMDGEGLRRFKTGWGAREEELRYSVHDLGRRCSGSRRGEMGAWSKRFFRAAPLQMSRLAGALLYRHMG